MYMNEPLVGRLYARWNSGRYQQEQYSCCKWSCRLVGEYPAEICLSKNVREDWREQVYVMEYFTFLMAETRLAWTDMYRTVIVRPCNLVLVCIESITPHVYLKTEPIGINHSDGKRPDGLTLTPWSKGKSLLWDATCYNTFASSYLPKTSKLAGSAAASAVTIKRNKYLDLLDRYNFVVFAVESMGPWCSGAKLLTSDIGKYLSALNGDSRSTAFLRQRIGIAIQRGNAISVMGTFPESKSLEEIFYFV
ncbi:hypothetical protein ANN_19986 [Periplaneta americana]|uniref:Uncharacterized protein n=1 Tax=Periplaneta americana TaxID=6978 RepID=A0ABQ8SBZ6_PERAM|nr:hypothetical protein ANN_19986 [Periplaneta americana]